MKKKLLIFSIGIIFLAPLKAQTDWGKFLATGVDDAEVLFEGYLSPYLNAFGASMTGGWYNTAKAHKLGGFDLTATFNTTIVPKDFRNFDVGELNLQNFELTDPSNNMAPTVAGDNEIGPALNYSNLPDELGTVEAFSTPKGSEFPYVPTPMLQLGLGLVKEIEIIGRYMPTFNYKDFSIGMWGIGIKHGIKQYIPVLEKAPVLNISVLGGFTKLNSSVGVGIDLADINASGATEVRYEDGTVVDDLNTVWDGQELKLTSTSFTGNILVSANLPIVCFYGGIGFATTKTNLKTSGYYPMFEMDGITPIAIALKDPIDMDVKNQDGNVTKPRFNAGVRFKFGVITLHGDYTYANYSLATVGLGISFR